MATHVKMRYGACRGGEGERGTLKPRMQQRADTHLDLLPALVRHGVEQAHLLVLRQLQTARKWTIRRARQQARGPPSRQSRAQRERKGVGCQNSVSPRRHRATRALPFPLPLLTARLSPSCATAVEAQSAAATRRPTRKRRMSHVCEGPFRGTLFERECECEIVASYLPSSPSLLPSSPSRQSLPNSYYVREEILEYSCDLIIPFVVCLPLASTLAALLTND